MCTFNRQGSIFNKMKFIITVFMSIFLMANNLALAGPLDKLERGLDRLFGKEVESGSDIKAAKISIRPRSNYPFKVEEVIEPN